MSTPWVLAPGECVPPMGPGSECVREGMKNLPKSITCPQFPSITAYDDDDGEEEDDVFIGDIAVKYLRKFAAVSGADKTFKLRDKDV